MVLVNIFLDKIIKKSCEPIYQTKRKYLLKIENDVVDYFINKEIPKKILNMIKNLKDNDVILLPFVNNNYLYYKLNKKMKLKCDIDNKNFLQKIYLRIVNESNLKYNSMYFKFTVVESCFILIQATNEILNMANINNSLLCPICINLPKNYSTLCGHLFCNDCLDKIINSTKKCPICNRKIHNYIKIFL